MNSDCLAGPTSQCVCLNDVLAIFVDNFNALLIGKIADLYNRIFGVAVYDLASNRCLRWGVPLNSWYLVGSP